jgi:acyl dehydratase
MPAPFFEEIVAGDSRDLGAFRFTAEDIVRFARAYDPQPFHTDPEAARRSHFGALCASGWHTAAVWMKHLVAERERARQEALSLGRRPAQHGSSPGFRDLKWLRPVYAGDTLRFRSTVTDKRASASRSGWGLVFSHNIADNQHGQRVFEFAGVGFLERRPNDGPPSAGR